MMLSVLRMLPYLWRGMPIKDNLLRYFTLKYSI